VFLALGGSFRVVCTKSIHAINVLDDLARMLLISRWAAWKHRHTTLQGEER
jgi:hypothetical protein